MADHQNQYHFTDENPYIIILKKDICYFQQDDVVWIFLSSFLLKGACFTHSYGDSDVEKDKCLLKQNKTIKELVLEKQSKL